MASLSLPAKAESLARAIHEFQRDTGNKKASCIESTLQELVDHIAATKPKKSPLLDVPKRKTRASASASSRFYDFSWITDPDKFPEAVARFEEVVANSRTMDSSLQQSIANAVTSAVATAVVSIQTKHNSEMLSLREMIEKSLLLRASPSATPPPDLDATPKSHPVNDTLPKTERWNQANLGYFDPHLDRAHGEGEIVSVGKDVYYRNVVLFVQHLQSLVTFRGAALIKANIATSLRGSALEWYTSELSDFDRDAFNNDPGVKSWVNTLSHRFKAPTSMALGLLIDETYSVDDAHARRPPAQYVRAIMRHGIGCNIVDIANQLSFAYWGLASELQVFVSPPTESTKAADFIRTFEEKQEVWHEMMTTPSKPPRYYNPAWRSSPYRTLLPSQSKAFSRYQSQQRTPQSQQPWRISDRIFDLGQPTPPAGPQRQYTPQPFCQSFMPQRQQYPEQRSRMSSTPNAIPRTAPESQSTPYGTRTTISAANYNPSRQLSAPAQSAPRQAYQSNPPSCGYQKTDEKGVYQLDEDPVENQTDGFYTTFDENDENVTYADKGFEEVAVNFVGIETSCTKCRATFPSKSKLHYHLKGVCQEVTSPFRPPELASAIPIIPSKTVHQSFSSGLAFRGWTYATATVTLAPDHLPPDSNLKSTACLDTGYGVTLVDKNWLTKNLPTQKISTMSTPLKVRGIGASKHESREFAALSLYFPEKNNAGQLVYASITCEIHLVEDLRANLLIGNNIMFPEDFVIDVKGKKALIGSCKVTIPINARQHAQFLARKLLTNQETVVPPNSEAMISLLPLHLPDDRDFLFYPAT